MNTLENPTLYREKWGLQEYTLFFLFWLKHIDCRYSLGLPHDGGSNEHPQSMFGAKIKKIPSIIIINTISRSMKYCITLYMYREVYIMWVTSEKPSSASHGFFHGYSGFPPPLINNQLDIGEMFLKGW